MAKSPVFHAPTSRSWWRSHGTMKIIGLSLLVLLLVYYPIGMIVMSRIDDNLNFDVTTTVPEGGSQTVKLVADLISHEVNDTGWVANDPFFMPSSLLDNMPNFQQGEMDAFARFAFELVDQIGRQRGSSSADKDLQEASGLLQYSGTKWVFDFSTSILPTASSETQYRKAIRALRSYNKRLVAGDAVFERRSDNLQRVLDRIALDLGSTSAAIDRHVRDSGGDPFDSRCDDLFYRVKGQAYGYYMILRGLRADFASVIKKRNLTSVWDDAMASFAEIVTLRPWIVWNGAPDGQLLPNHLLAQGFFLLRARVQLRELTSILEK